MNIAHDSFITIKKTNYSNEKNVYNFGPGFNGSGL